MKGASEGCKAKLPCPGTQTPRDNVPMLRGEKHDISLKTCLKQGLNPRSMAAEITKRHALTIVLCPILDHRVQSFLRDISKKYNLNWKYLIGSRQIIWLEPNNHLERTKSFGLNQIIIWLEPNNLA